MIIYLDTSVLLRWVLDAPHQLASPEALGVERAFASELLETEAIRAIDALRLRRRWSTREAATRRAKVEETVAAVDLVALSDVVWRRVRDPHPEPLSTLDAIHLCTALLLRDIEGIAVDAVLTHDTGLAAGARAYGFRVVGEAG